MPLSFAPVVRSGARVCPFSPVCSADTAARTMIMWVPHPISCGIHMKSEIPVDQAQARPRPRGPRHHYPAIRDVTTHSARHPVRSGWSAAFRSREPLNATVEAVTRRQNGQTDGVTRSSMPGRGVPGKRVFDRDPLDRLDRLPRDPVAADLVRRERVGGKPVGVEPAGSHPFQPAALDDVDAGRAALAEEPFQVGGGGGRHRPDAAARAVPWEPEHRRVTRVDGPHQRWLVRAGR